MEIKNEFDSIPELEELTEVLEKEGQLQLFRAILITKDDQEYLIQNVVTGFFLSCKTIEELRFEVARQVKNLPAQQNVESEIALRLLRNSWVLQNKKKVRDYYMSICACSLKGGDSITLTLKSKLIQLSIFYYYNPKKLVYDGQEYPSFLNLLLNVIPEEVREKISIHTVLCWTKASYWEIQADGDTDITVKPFTLQEVLRSPTKTHGIPDVVKRRL